MEGGGGFLFFLLLALFIKGKTLPATEYEEYNQTGWMCRRSFFPSYFQLEKKKKREMFMLTPALSSFDNTMLIVRTN
jgi:hypothetical protein